MWHRIGPFLPDILGICLCVTALLLVPLVGLFNETALQRRAREVALHREATAWRLLSPVAHQECPAPGGKGSVRCDTPY